MNQNTPIAVSITNTPSTVAPEDFPIWCRSEAGALYDYAQSQWDGNPEDALRLPCSSDEGYECQHNQLLSVVAFAVNKLELHCHEDRWHDFSHTLTSQYEDAADGHPHENGAYQFSLAVEKAMKGDGTWDREVSETKVDKDAKFDEGLLSKYPAISKEVIKSRSPLASPETLTLDDFLVKAFPVNTVNDHLVALAPSRKHVGLPYRPHTGVPPIDPFSKKAQLLTDQLFISRSLFKKETGGTGFRTKENRAATPYLVFECDIEDDKETIAKFSGFAMMVAEYAPLVAVIDSGKKSLHFWFATHDTSKEVIKAVSVQASRHGADRAVLNNQVSLVRAPNVGPTADSGAGRGAQTLLYFDEAQTDPNSARDWDIKAIEEGIFNFDHLRVYYSGGTYLQEADDGSWIEMNASAVEQTLRVDGYRPTKLEDEFATPIDNAMTHIRKKNNITTTLDSLGGYDSGVHLTETGNKMIVKTSRRFPTILNVTSASDLRFPNFKRYLDDLLDPFEKEVFLAWLSHAVKCSYNGGSKVAVYGDQAQFLNLAGEPGAGKTTLFTKIVAPLIGGRIGDPKELFTNTEFNSMAYSGDLAHIDDVDYLTEETSNREMQSNVIRNFVASPVKQVHPKHRNRVRVWPFCRLTRSMNRDDIGTMPLMHKDGIGDKVIVLYGHNRGEKKSSEWCDNLVKFGHMGEYDAFFTYLLRFHAVPEEVIDPEGRYPCVSYKADDVVCTLQECSTASGVADFMSRDTALPYTTDPNTGDKVYEGTLTMLYDTLKENSVMNGEADFVKKVPTPNRLSKMLTEVNALQNGPITAIYSNAKDCGIKTKKQFDGNTSRNYYWRIKKHK